MAQPGKLKEIRSITPIQSNFNISIDRQIESHIYTSKSDLDHTASTNLYVSFAGASSGSIDLVSTEYPEDLWQRLEWDQLEVYFDVEAVFKEQQGDILAFSLVKKGGMVKYRGKGTQYNSGSSSIYEFNRTQNIEIDHENGELHYSLSEKDITFLQFSIPPSASYPYAEQVVFTDNNIQVKLMLPPNNGWWFTGANSYYPIPEPAFIYGGQFPVAGFIYSPTEPETGDTIIFDASSSTDPDGGNPFYLSAQWDFGDGYYGTGRISEHHYRSPGEYNVCLTITDVNKLSDRTCKTIRVVQGLQAPVALFNYLPENPSIEDSIFFDASDSFDPDGDIVSYIWDFGNGSSASGSIVKIKYSEAASYTVRLTVIDSHGLLDETSRIVNLTDNLVSLSGSLYNTRFEEDGSLDSSLPLVGALVEVYENNNLLQSTETSQTGAFRFEQLSEDQTYDLRITASGQLAGSGDTVTVLKTVEGRSPMDSFKASLPLELNIQKYNLLYELEHLGIHPEMFGNEVAIPLIRSYDESKVNTLISAWNENISSDETRRIQAIARLLMTEQVFDTLYDHATITSHLISNGIYSTTTAALGFLDYFSIFKKSFIPETSQEVTNLLINYFFPKIDEMIYDFFISQFANWVISSLPAEYSSPLSSGIYLVKKYAFSDSDEEFFKSILKDGFKKVVVTSLDNVILSSYYIPATQGYVDISAIRAQTIESVDDLTTPLNATRERIHQSWLGTEETRLLAESFLNNGQITEQASEFLLLPPATPALALLSAMSVSFRTISLAFYTTASIRAGLWLHRLATDGIPSGTESAFLTGSKKSLLADPIICPESCILQSNTCYNAEHLSTVEHGYASGNLNYLSILSDLIYAVENGNRNKVIEAVPELMNADDLLSETQSEALGPVFATAEYAHREVENYGDQYQLLNETITQSISERFHFYTQLMTWLFDESYSVDSLVIQAERTRISLYNVEQILDETTALIASIQAPPFVRIKEVSVDPKDVKPGFDFILEANIKNIGPLDADSVKVELLVDSIASINSQKELLITDLASGESRDVSWTLRVIDTLQYMGSYVIRVYVPNGKGLSCNGIYTINAAGQSTGKHIRHEGLSEVALKQNFPNPFSDHTTINYLLPMKTRIYLEVVDMNGKQVRLLTNEIQNTGVYQVDWDGTDFNGSELPNGVYFYRLITDSEVKSRKMVIMD